MLINMFNLPLIIAENHNAVNTIYYSKISVKIYVTIRIELRT